MSQPERESVAIVGAGSLGTLLAISLRRAAVPVRVLVRGETRAAALKLEAPGAEPTVDPAVLAAAAILFFCVKSYQTAGAAAAIAPALRAAPHPVPVVSLQNGWGNLDLLERALPGTPLVAGSTTLGAFRDGTGMLRTSTRGLTIFAPWTPDAAPSAAAASRLFEAAGLRAETASDARDVLWRKLVLNVGVNPVTAIHAVPNGALLDIPALHELAAGIAREAAAVGAARGYVAASFDPLPSLDALLRDTAENRSSMAEDLAQGRPTEADAILGAVIREGAAAGVSTSLTAAAAARLAGMESGR